MASASLGEATAGLLTRLSNDPDLFALVGSDVAGARIEAAWPTEYLENPVEDEFPRISITRVDRDTIHTGFGEVRYQLDIWVWPDGEAGGPDQLDAIERRVLELVDEQWWVHDGARLFAFEDGGADGRGGPVLRRRIDLMIGVG